MMLSSYLALLRADANWESLDVIGDKSLAERAPVGLLVGGLWSAWEPITEPPIESGRLFSTPHLGLFRASLTALINVVLLLAGQPIAAREWKQAIGGWETSDPTSSLLKEYLKQRVANTEAKTVSEFIAMLNAPDISLATGLPVRVIQKLLSEVKALFETRKPAVPTPADAVPV